MKLLDFIKDRHSQSQSTEQPKLETAKEMYTREAVEERTATKQISLGAEPAASAKEAGDLFRKGTGQIIETAPTPAPADGTANPQPMKQNMIAQDATAPALTPTSGQTGKTVDEIEPPRPTPTQPSSPDRSKAMVRMPSLER